SPIVPIVVGRKIALPGDYSGSSKIHNHKSPHELSLDLETNWQENIPQDQTSQSGMGQAISKRK
ncbi:hypothetical protein, partial [Pseudomonas aeruginosa]|uniref:hypothetical protein n=1 Tax=Pseudomonas aeruginosa TaxID=287 RepID=UPI003F5205A1